MSRMAQWICRITVTAMAFPGGGLAMAPDAALPGSGIRLADDAPAPFGLVAACVAIEEPAMGPLVAGSRRVTQRFQVIEVLWQGVRGLDDLLELRYVVSAEPLERAIRRGERVLWVADALTNRRWRGRKALPFTPAARDEALQGARRSWEMDSPNPFLVDVDLPREVFALGESLPASVNVFNTSADRAALWSDIVASRFECFADDGQPVLARSAPEPIPARSEPLWVEPREGPHSMTDLRKAFDWLPAGGVRSFSLFWRGSLQVGDAHARPLECVSRLVPIMIRDPATLAWGRPSDGLSCGIATESILLSEGDRVVFHFGLAFDSTGVDPKIDILDVFEQYDKIEFTFTDVSSGRVFQRETDWMRGGPISHPRPRDLLRLRRHPLTIASFAVRLLSSKGESIPAGVYAVQAVYENEGCSEMDLDVLRHERPHQSPWKPWRGTITSAPIFLRVQHADPKTLVLWTNSALRLRIEPIGAQPGQSQDNPDSVRIEARPGFVLGKNLKLFVSLDGGEYTKELESPGGSVWNHGEFISVLRPEVAQAVAAGKPVKLYGQVTIFETADASYVHWFPRPGWGDYRALWHGTIEGGIP